MPNEPSERDTEKDKELKELLEKQELQVSAFKKIIELFKEKTDPQNKKPT